MRFVVTQTREYLESWLVEANSEAEAYDLLNVLDHDDGSGNDSCQETNVRQVDDDQDEL